MAELRERADVNGSAGLPTPDPFTILFEDDDLLAVDKPAGLVVHPAYRHPDGTLFDAVLARQLARGETRPWLLHRLDRDTSGVVLFAKTMPARRALVRQFERRLVRKWYLALVVGCPADHDGAIVQPLRRDPLDRRRVMVDPTGKPAETRYTVLAADEERALLLVEPRTGRTHQIRAHLAWLGHPLRGDSTYAAPSAASAPSAGSAYQAPARQMLHAWAVGVRYPGTGAPLRIVAPLPADLAARLPSSWRAHCADALAAWDITNGTSDDLDDPEAHARGDPPNPAANPLTDLLSAQPSTLHRTEEATHASFEH